MLFKRFFFLLTAFIMVASCMVMGSTFRDEALRKLEPGMTENEVIKILGSEPNSRSSYPNGTYLLQWFYSYGTPVGGGGRHIAILFGYDQKMIKLMHQTKIGSESLIQ